MTRNPDQAADCAQDTFIKAWKALPKFEARSSFSTWLHRIAVNTVLEKRRGPSKAEIAVEDPTEYEEAEAVLDSPVEEEELEAAIASLPQGARDALVSVWGVRLRTFGSRGDAGHRRRHLQGAAASGARPAEGQAGTRCAMTTRKVKRLDELAQSVPPPRDLWPAIAQAIEADQAAAAPQASPRPAPRARWMPAVGMAAAVALVAIGVLIGQNFGGVTVGDGGRHDQGSDGRRMPAALRDADYRKQREVLLTEVDSRLKSMPEAERVKVAASLATLRRSIGEIEAALGRDPANALLQELLVSSCQEEMRALTAVRDAGGQEI